MRRSQVLSPVRSIEDRNALVLQHQRLPYYVLYKMWGSRLIRNLTFCDAIQVAYLKLIRAAELWQEDRGVQFISYAYRSVQLGIYSAARRSIKQSDPLVDAVSLSNNNWSDNSLLEDTKEDSLICKEAKQAWKLLPKRSRYIVWRVVVDERTYAQVGDVLRLTKERVRQLLNDALEWMRSYVEGENPHPLKYDPPREKRKVI